MAKQRKQEWVVRIVLFRGINQDDKIMDNPFLESLRYAGLIHIHRDDEKGMCFDLLPPKGLDTHVWADQNSRRMTTFGFNAVMAPAWPARVGRSDGPPFDAATATGMYDHD